MKLLTVVINTMELYMQFQRPMWQVLTGRKDGRVSLASDIPGNLPPPTADFTSLQQLFASKGLDVMDLVALSGKKKNVFFCKIMVLISLYNFLYY